MKSAAADIFLINLLALPSNVISGPEHFDGGLFVHTGRSGAALYPEMDAGGIALLSGDRLIRLVRERVLDIRLRRGRGVAADTA